MKGLVFDEELMLKDNLPVMQLPGEALIKVTAAGICNTDVEIIKGYMGFSGILGHEFVGIVEEADNKNLIGKRVCGEINCVCGKCRFCSNNMTTHCTDRSVLGIFKRDGAFCEYTSLPEENLHILPDSISDDEAVFVEPVAAAFRILEEIPVNPNDKVVILGDGKLGLLVAQVLSLFSKDVITVGKHKNKLALLQKTNIKTVLVDELEELSADIVVEATGRKEGLDLALKLIRPMGTIVLKTTIAEKVAFDTAKIVVDEIKVIGSRCGPFKPAIEALANKQINVLPLISAVYSFDEAIEAMERAQKPGVIKVLLKF